MKMSRLVQRLFGFLSAGALLVLSLTPGMFHVPVAIQPWLFLANIAWIVVLTSGVFSS